MQFDLTPAQRALQAKARELARGPIADARRRDRPQRTIPLGQCRAAEGGRVLRHDDPGRLWRARGELPRCGPRHRRDGEMLRRHRPHRRRGQYGRDRRHHEIRQRGAEAACRRPRPIRRQAGHLHHRAGCRQRRQRDDDARRPSRQRLRDQRQEALDHRRRRVAAPPRLRPRLRRERRRGRDRRLHRDPRRDQGPRRSASASRRWGCAASPRRRSCSRTWR